MSDETTLELKLLGDSSSAVTAVEHVNKALEGLSRESQQLSFISKQIANGFSVMAQSSQASTTSVTAGFKGMQGAVGQAAAAMIANMKAIADQQNQIAGGRFATLIGNMQAQTQALQQSIQQHNQALQRTTQTTQQTQGVFQQFTSFLGQARQGWVTLAAQVYLAERAFATVKGAFSTVFSELDQGDKVNQITTAFSALQASAGLLASDQMPRLREATRGLISDFDLMRASNLWQTLRLAPESFASLSEAAVKLGASVGRNATQAINDLTIGLGRQSPRILDNLGIIVKANDAYRNYAESVGKTVKQLTDSEKREAFVALAMQRILDATAKLPEPLDNAGRAYERLKASMVNAGNEFAVAVTHSSSLEESLERVDTWLKTTDWTSWGDKFAGAASVALTGLQKLLNLIPDANNKFVQLGDYAIQGTKVAQLADLQTRINTLQGRNNLAGRAFEATFATPGGDKLADLPKLQADFQKLIDEERGKLLTQRAEILKDTVLATYSSTAKALQGVSLTAIDTKAVDERLAEEKRKADEKAAKAAARVAAQEAKAAETAIDSLIKKYDELGAKAQEASLKTQLDFAVSKGDTSGIDRLNAEFRQQIGQGTLAGLQDAVAKAAAGGMGGQAEALAHSIADLTVQVAIDKTTAALTQKINQLSASLTTKGLNFQLEDAYKTGNLAAVPAIEAQLKEATRVATLQGLEEAYPGATPEQRKAMEGVAKAVADEYGVEAGRKLEEATKQAFNNSVSFFADIFDSAINGTTQSWLDTLKNGLEKVAIGFGAQILANMTSGLGINFSTISSAQGLGQSLAASLGFKGGTTQSILTGSTQSASGDIFGSAQGELKTALDGLKSFGADSQLHMIALQANTSALTALTAAVGGQTLVGGANGFSSLLSTGQSVKSAYEFATGPNSIFGSLAGAWQGGTSGIGPVASGSQYAASLEGAQAAGGLSSSLSSLAGSVTPLAAVVGGLLLEYQTATNFANSKKTPKDKAVAAGSSYFAGDPTGFSELYYAIGAPGLGGNPKLGEERKRREEIIKDLFGDTKGKPLTIYGADGPITIATADYKNLAFNVTNPKELITGNPRGPGSSYLTNSEFDYKGGLGGQSLQSFLSNLYQDQQAAVAGVRPPKGKFPGSPGAFSLSQSITSDLSATPSFGQVADFLNPVTAGIGAIKGLDPEKDKKVLDDLNGILTNAAAHGKDFADVLINVGAELDKMGVNTGQLKDNIVGAFLDGSVSLGSFNQQFQEFTLLGQKGTHSVDEDIKLFTTHLENPRTAIKAIEFAFNDLKEQGITSTQAIHSYIAGHFGPEVTAIFDQLGSAGFHSWQEIEQGGSDAMFALINIINQYANATGQAFGSTADGASTAATGTDKLTASLLKAKKAADDLNGSLNGTSGNGNGNTDTDTATKRRTDPNQRVKRVTGLSGNKALNPKGGG